MDRGLEAAWMAELKTWLHGRGIEPTDIQLRNRPDGQVIATCQLVLPPYPHIYRNAAGAWCREECSQWPEVD